MLTVHRSKGLEFPIVYYPHLWEPGYIPPGLPVAYHDPHAGDRRTIDVGLEGPDFDRHKEQHLVEERGEDLRLAYVALTRAKHQAVVWWAPSWNSRDSRARAAAVRARGGRDRAGGRPQHADRRGGLGALRGARRRGDRAASASSARGSGGRRRGAARCARPPR